MRQIKLFVLLNPTKLATILLTLFLLIGCKASSSPESDFKVNVTGETITEYIGNDIEVVIPTEIYGEKITTVGNSAFQNKEIIKVTIPIGITDIKNWAFSGSKLRKIDIPNTIKTIGKNAFNNCQGLKEIVLPNSLSEIGDAAFSSCSNLKNVVIPSSLSNIGNEAFSRCSNLQTIEVDTKNTKYCSVDGVLFNKDKTTILQYPSKKETNKYVIPNSVLDIASSAFINSINLSSIDIPTSVKNIGEYAFEGCTSLENVIIPYSITSIGEWAFEDCVSLKTIRIEAVNPPKIKNLIFGSLGSNDGDNLVIEVPKGSFKAYNDSWGFWMPNKFEYVGY